MGRTASWPKTLDIIFIVLFGILTILAWTLPENRDTIKYFANVIINGGLALGVAITWMAGHPFIRSYIEDNVGIEGSTYPVVKHMGVLLVCGWWHLQLWHWCLYLRQLCMSREPQYN